MKKYTLVLGASLNTERYSNKAIHALVNHNIHTEAIGLKEGEVSGVQIKIDLSTYLDIDTITLYLNPKRQKDYYTYIIALKPKRVIFNPGTENKALMVLLDKNKIMYEEACTLTLLATAQY